MKKLDQAEEQFRKGIKNGHELSCVNLIILLNELQRLPEARTLATEAAIAFPSNAELRFHLANTLGKLGEYELAEVEYFKALNIRGRSSYWTNLGVLYHRWGRLEDAEAAYMSALNLDHGN